VTKGNEKLLQEATAAAARPSRASSLAGRVASERQRLIPYAAAGGAAAGAMVGLLGNAVSSGNAGQAIGVGAAVGLGAGMSIGWAALGIVEARTRSVAPRRLATLRRLTAVGVYGVAGITASVTTTTLLAGAAVAFGRVGGFAFGIGILGLAVVPVTLAFAGSSGSTPIQATTLANAISETWSGGGHSAGTGDGRLAITAALSVGWFLASTAGVLGGLAVVHSMDAGRYAAATETYGSILGGLVLIAWLSLLIGGFFLIKRLVLGGPTRGREARRKNRR
jgi:hypothetical protein